MGTNVAIMKGECEYKTVKPGVLSPFDDFLTKSLSFVLHNPDDTKPLAKRWMVNPQGNVVYEICI